MRFHAHGSGLRWRAPLPQSRVNSHYAGRMRSDCGGLAALRCRDGSRHRLCVARLLSKGLLKRSPKREPWGAARPLDSRLAEQVVSAEPKPLMWSAGSRHAPGCRRRRASHGGNRLYSRLDAGVAVAANMMQASGEYAPDGKGVNKRFRRSTSVRAVMRPARQRDIGEVTPLVSTNFMCLAMRLFRRIAMRLAMRLRRCLGTMKKTLEARHAYSLRQRCVATMQQGRVVIGISRLGATRIQRRPARGYALIDMRTVVAPLESRWSRRPAIRRAKAMAMGAGGGDAATMTGCYASSDA